VCLLYKLGDEWIRTTIYAFSDESKRLKKVYFKSQVKTPQEKRRDAASSEEKWKIRMVAILFFVLWLILTWFIVASIEGR
jgi:hypothetical protein